MLNSSNHLMAHLRELAGRIGIRYVGSPGNRAAAEYIRYEMEQAGLAVEIQPSECPEWTVRRLACEAEDILVNPFSPPVDATAPVVPLCTLAELAAADLRGRIALLYGDLSAAPVSPKRWFLKTERDERIIGLIERKAPAAVLSAQPAVPYFAHGFCDAEFAVPSATLPHPVALELLRGNPPVVRLAWETESRPGSTANIVGRMKGSRPEKIVLCAHYDTATTTPGACDNAGGIAILLALADHWTAKKLDCGLEFAALSGHEYLPIGVDRYLQTASPEKMIAALNFDGAGHRLGTNTLTAMSASDAMIRTARSVLDRYPGAVWTDPWPESDHSAFAMRGVPALAFGGTGVRDIHHTPEDTIEGMSAEKLMEAASLAAEIVEVLQKKSIGWGRG
jgi:aminopeptidase YwaD